MAPKERWSRLGLAAVGAILGGLVGGFVVVVVTLVLKAGIDFVTAQRTWAVVVVPLLGLTAAVVVLQGLGAGPVPEEDRAHLPRSSWREFPHDAVRTDIKSDVVDAAGKEETFPWRLAPLRGLAIVATVATGNAMGTEAPAVYLGVATGVWLGDRGRRWRKLLRPAALGGGAAGVGALMGIPLMGAAFILELGRRKDGSLSAERLLAALIGGFIGWGIDVVFGLKLVGLVVPREAPGTFLQAVITAVFIGGASGAISSLAGLAAYQAKHWRAAPAVRLAAGGAVIVAVALVIARLAAPFAAAGPGSGAIRWAETSGASPLMLLTICLLRAAATTATVAAGGCGGVFIPFLSVGDLAGRVFAPGLGVGSDLAGAAGAAGGIAAGYRLPVTAAFMVLGVGGPPRAVATCLVALVMASAAGAAVETLLERMGDLLSPRRRATVH
jgi:H+/Cl- antiporter ClcA